MQIGLGVGVTRLGVAEQITGLWSFLHAQGLLANDIGERTAAHGVEIDGLLVKDAGVPQAAVTAHEAALAILESQIADGSILARLAAAEDVTGAWTFKAATLMEIALGIQELAAGGTTALFSKVTGDSLARFLMSADGEMEWGPGDGARDISLVRRSVGRLAITGDLDVDGALDLVGDLELSQVTPASFAASQNNFATGTATVQFLNNTSGSTKEVTGFAGGRAGRIIIIRIVDASFQVDLINQSGSSSANNRMMLPAGATFSITGSQSIVLFWHSALNRWIPIADSS